MMGLIVPGIKSSMKGSFARLRRFDADGVDVAECQTVPAQALPQGKPRCGGRDPIDL